MGPLQGEDGQDVSRGDFEEDSGCPGLLPLGALIPQMSFASPDLGLLQEFISKLLKSEWPGSATPWQLW